MFGTEPGGFFKVMVHRDKDEFYKGIQKEAEDRGTTLLSVCFSIYVTLTINKGFRKGQRKRSSQA